MHEYSGVILALETQEQQIDAWLNLCQEMHLDMSCLKERSDFKL